MYLVIFKKDKNKLITDKNRRKAATGQEQSRKMLRFFVKHEKLAVAVRQKAWFLLLQLNKKGSRGRVVNRCNRTAKGRSVCRFTRRCRTSRRNIARAGLLAGVKKHSW